MTEDRFILIGLDDENSRDVADIIGNKTCKKILDFLADRKEASEKDISDGLKMRINTVEYNLKKLVKVGLVENSKNFFWSVKGKKIPMYKLARKHIIIGTKKPDLRYLKSIIPIVLIAGILMILFVMYVNNNGGREMQSASYNEGIPKEVSLEFVDNSRTNLGIEDINKNENKILKNILIILLILMIIVFIVFIFLKNKGFFKKYKYNSKS